MQGFNKIHIAGHIARDPELRYSGQGMAIASTSIATSEKKKNSTGEYEETTTWFRLTLFGKSAETFHQYARKGQTCYFEGRLTQESYTDRDGNTRTNLNIIVSDWKNLERRSESASEQPAAQASAPEPRDFGSLDDDSIPF